MNAVYTVLLKNQEFRWANHLNWLKDLASLISRGRLFQRTAPLWLKLFFVKLVRGNGTISAHECACASADCVPLKSCKQLILFVFEMYGKQGFKAVHKTVHLVKLIGKGCSFFFRVLISNYLWYKPHNNRTNLYNFRFVLMLVCFSA